jgi:26 proteasome complex subunit DSS1
MSKDPKTENVEAKTTAPASSAPALPEPEVVDEDDEFEDFPTETWGADQLAGAAEEGLWADDWEDEDVDADFDKVLREELDKSAAAAAASIPSK